MNEGWKRFHGTDEEVMWRIQVLKRTSRLCAAKAKELERMAKADGDMPAMDHASLMDVLKRIDNVMEWRFVTPWARWCWTQTSSPRASTARPCAPCGSAS